ncbi:MAG: RidA family protein [Pseudomonadota bacterium]
MQVSHLITALVAGTLFVAAANADEAVYTAPLGRDNAPYSESVVYDDFIFLAGQLGVDRATGEMPEGIGPQTFQALTNMKGALERAGGSMDAVLKCTVFLADIDDWAAMNEVYVTFFPNKPARTAIGGAGMGGEALVEIECIAAAPDDDEEREDEEHEPSDMEGPMDETTASDGE